MLAILAALLPVFALVALGAVLRRSGFLAGAFWRPAERLTYFILLPALLVHNLATADLSGVALVGPIAACVLPLFGGAAVLLALRPVLAVDGPGFSSVVQGGVRFNSFVGIAAAAELHGKPGLTMAAVAMAAIVPFANAISIAALARYAGSGKLRPAAFARAILTNPLIVATLVGAALNASHVGLPFALEPTFRLLGQASLPLGLFAVGAALDLTSFRAAGRALAAALGVKLLVVPAMAAAACALLGVGGLAASVAVLLHALPSAPSAYILARQLGGDHGLMAGILTLQTVAAAATIPVVLALLG